MDVVADLLRVSFLGILRLRCRFISPVRWVVELGWCVGIGLERLEDREVLLEGGRGEDD